MSYAYQRIPTSEDEQVHRPWVLTPFIAVLSVFVVTTNAPKHVGLSMYRVGTSLTECCDCAPITPAPTPFEDWEIFWTDGSQHDSYIWTMNNFDMGLKATVLVQSGVTAMGVDVHNDTVYFDGAGCVSKLTTTVETLLCYNNSDMQGLIVTDAIYWADAATGFVYRSTLDGAYHEMAHFDQPVDVAYDRISGLLFVSAADGIYFAKGNGKRLYIDAHETYGGLDFDAVNRELWYVADDAIYKVRFAYVDSTRVYSGLANAKGLTLDEEQGLLFFTDKKGVYKGHTDGSGYVTVATVDDARFVAVNAQPAPTPQPTFLPSQIPTGRPSPVPSSCPSALPSIVPSSMPSKAPTSLPTASPSVRPTPLPTALPSFLPTSSPSAVPTPVPTPVPTSSPSSLPTPAPTTVCHKFMVDCGYCECLAH